ncbi:MAG: hypothetical protein QXW79_00895 [Thermoplasmata archaeon]
MRPTLKLEMYEPQQTKDVPYGVYSTYIPKIHIPGISTKFSPSVYSHLFAPTEAISYGPNVQMPVQQVYNITLPGPTGTHVEMNKIYENILPGKDNKLTSITLGERLQMYDYVRQVMIKINEGEEISLDSEGQNSLLSYIRLMELNPNYYSPIHHNPYRGLPYGLLIYRSCFPIRLDRRSQSVICARDSIGLNIRIYSLSYAEYYSYKFRQAIYKEYDVWRELAYYEYIRENILKKRRSPNFPLLYAFFFCPNRNIDFFKLKKNCLTQKDLLTAEYKKFVEMHTLFSKVKPSTEVIRPMTLLEEAARNVIAKLPDEIDPKLQAYSGTTLILITEAPHYNLYQWTSRTYERDGIVQRMINHGYYDADVWITILFQIISALYVMQLHGIYIRNMTIEDNIYIRDLQISGKAMGYWKYIINGVSYYIPNYGYIVLIDSNFKDIESSGKTIEKREREYKIYMADIDRNKYSLNSIQEKIFENYRRIINTNVFSKEHTQNNVNRPPESIMKLIGNMMEDQETNLEKIIFKHFRSLMNNRIGTYLRRDTELPNIRAATGPFKYGDMAIEVVAEDTYKWCLIVGPKGDGVVEIVTRETPESNDFINKDVRVDLLRQYSTTEKIEQNLLNSDISFSEDHLLETYIIGQ